MPDRQQFINSLSLKLELFTSLVPLPTLIYFVSVFGGREGTDDILNVGLSGSIFGIMTVLFGVYIRKLRLSRLFLELERLNKNIINTHDKKELKLRILNYPILEAQMIAFRWLIGVTGALVIFYILSGSMPSGIFYTTNFGLFFVLPISIVMYLYTTEMYIGKLLRLREIMIIHVPIKQVKYFGAYKRIFLAIFSVAIIPVSILGYILYSVIHNELKLNYPGIHIFILSFGALLSMIIVSSTFAFSLRESLQYNNEILIKIAKGEFEEESSVFSTD